MTPEEKQVLIKDLCARLPYITYYDLSYYGHKTRAVLQEFITTKDPLKSLVKVNTIASPIPYENIKPYLRPMSSMTEEEKDELALIGDKDFQSVRKWYNAEYMNETDPPCPVTSGKVDYCNKNHFDFRGLIPMGLALEAPEDMYKTE